MSQTALIVVGGVAVGGGLVYLHLRRKAAAQGSSSCAALGGLVGAAINYASPAAPFTGPPGMAPVSPAATGAKIATAICGNLGAITAAGQAVVNALGHLVGIRSLAEKLEVNERKNGAVVEAVDPELPWAGGALIGTHKGGLGPRNKPAIGPMKHANGCVPYNGHPEFAKCAPGSYGLKHLNFGAGVGTGATAPKSKDPYSFEHPAGEAFPLPLAPGDRAYWFNGKPMKCAAGSVIAIDHRTGTPVPSCARDTAPPVRPRGGYNDPHYTETTGADGTEIRDHRS